MLATSLVAIDSTIIATAVPSVVADLGGFAQFPWLFSVYLLAQAVAVPVYGKLADVLGRKPIMLLGIGLFLAGSALAAAAWSMPALIAFRALQGLGAGAIQPMSLTIAGDIYTLAERGRVQGYLASVWGASAVAGPALGGVFSEYLTWRWIFIVNIPLCVIAALALIRNLREAVARRPHRIDYAGSALLAAGCGLVILGLLEGGQAWPWSSPPGIGVPAAGVALLALFILAQRRAAGRARRSGPCRLRPPCRERLAGRPCRSSMRAAARRPAASGRSPGSRWLRPTAAGRRSPWRAPPPVLRPAGRAAPPGRSGGPARPGRWEQRDRQPRPDRSRAAGRSRASRPGRAA